MSVAPNPRHSEPAPPLLPLSHRLRLLRLFGCPFHFEQDIDAGILRTVPRRRFWLWIVLFMLLSAGSQPVVLVAGAHANGMTTREMLDVAFRASGMSMWEQVGSALVMIPSVLSPIIYSVVYGNMAAELDDLMGTFVSAAGSCVSRSSDGI